MNIEAVIAGYIALRNQKEDIGKRHTEELAPIRANMEKLELFLRSRLQDMGLTNLAAKGVGTAFLETKTEANVADWDATLAWIKETGAYEFLEKRVSKTVVKDYIESHGDVPPGINVTSEIVVRVRKAS